MSTDAHPRASIAAMYEHTIAWLDANPHDYESLASGPLGEALTRAELHDLANEPESMPRFIEGLREQVAREISDA